jgi:hypothetical protein
MPGKNVPAVLPLDEGSKVLDCLSNVGLVGESDSEVDSGFVAQKMHRPLITIAGTSHLNEIKVNSLEWFGSSLGWASGDLMLNVCYRASFTRRWYRG